jgi:hypothetical protein
MKKVLVILAAITLLGIGAIAYAHGPGGWGGGPGYGWSMMGPGYGGQMMGPGFGGHRGPGYGFMGRGGYTADSKFLDETAELRKELHTKRFEYFEALRNPKTTPETIAKLEKEIREIQEKIYEKSPRTAFGRFGGYGCNW